MAVRSLGLASKSALISGLLLAGGLGAACRGDSKPRAEETARAAEPGPPREVQLEPVVLQEIAQQIEISGTLAADVQVSLSTKVPGHLAHVLVDLSSPVKQGQVVAQIEATDYENGVRQAEAALAQVRAQLGLWGKSATSKVELESTPGVRQAQATLEEARANAQRMDALAAQGLTPEAELTTARATLARAEAALQTARQEVQLRQAELAQRDSELAIARQRLADTLIRSPIDGFVQTRWVNRGEYLAVGARVVDVMRIDPLRLRVALPERDAQRVAQGQAVEVTLDSAPPAATARGVVARVAPGFDADSRSLLIEADIPNPGSLRPGHFVRARIVVGVRKVPTVSRTALVSFAGLDKVLLVQDGKVVEIPVTLGDSAGDRVEVLRGLVPGQLVVRAPGSLQQGQAVRLSPASPDSAER
ncbi:MAG: efflux RND transporter periplasmic adaptor subunit [Deltaproteobacteria bacterium]